MRTNIYFPNNEYHTPSDKKRVVGDRLALGTSLYFNLRFLGIVYKNMRLAQCGKYDSTRWGQSSFEILRFIEDCGGKFHITGFEQVDSVRNEPVVFVSNHMSTLETMVFPCLISPTMPVTFVVKDSLLTAPLFGPVMRSRDPIAVGRKDPRADFTKVLVEGQKKLEKGISLIIFPQSTRSQIFAPKEFNSLGVKLAHKSGVKVVPMAIKTDFWSNGWPMKDLGRIDRKKHIHIKFGEPMGIKGQGKEEHQFTIDFIQKHLREWGGECSSEL